VKQNKRPTTLALASDGGKQPPADAVRGGTKSVAAIGTSPGGDENQVDYAILIAS